MPARHRITALEVYRDESLPFLLQLEKYYEKKDKSTSIIAETAEKSINKILSQSQTDLTNKAFIGEKDNMLNIRYRNYANFNLSQSTFKWVNLYSSDFTDATLIDATFNTTDLVKANFSGTNLKNVEFINSNLSGVNFVGALLRGAKFTNCRNIHKAKFSFNTLIFSNNTEYFDSINQDDYLEMLIPHKDDLEKELDKKTTVNNPVENKWRERLYKRLDITEGNEKEKRTELRKRLKELSAKITNDSLEKYSQSSPIDPIRASIR